MSNKNEILYAEEDGYFLLRFIGEVRLTVCVILSEYIENIFKSKDLKAVTIDLRSATILDSTTLGLLARMALKLKPNVITSLSIICDHEDLLLLLKSMGMYSLFNISNSIDEYTKNLSNNAIQCTDSSHPSDSDTVKSNVIIAHKTLMSLSSNNHDKFKNLIALLESP